MTSQLYLHLNWISLTHEAEHSRCSVAHRQRFDMYVVDISVSSINNIWNTCLDVYFILVASCIVTLTLFGLYNM